MGRHIGLVGPKHSGKTTAGEYLVGRGFTKIALADPLKNVAVQMLNAFHLDEGLPPIDRAFLDEHKDEVFVPFLQWLGSEYGREFLHSPDRWINKFLKETYSSPTPVVCDDVRFPNEADTLRVNGFLIVRIVRTPEARAASLVAAGVDPETANHQSEMALDQINPDVLIYPSDDLDSLYAHVEWCTAFHALCAELTEMSAYVPYHAHPGYNADFNERATALVATHDTLILRITSTNYTSMFNLIQAHAEATPLDD